MSDRARAWVTWVLIVVSAIVIGVIRATPIVIPPPPISEPAPPTTRPPEPPGTQPDPLNAIVRISRPGVGCSATIIGPRRADGRYWVLSACHCTDRAGERWSARFRDGRTTGLVVVARSERPDFSWMLTDVDTQIFPYALLRDTDPTPGEKVWHAGFGVDKPGNREDGVVTRAMNADGQIGYRISVSSGDSGGGIMLDSEGKVMSPVCCTTAPGRNADVWGSSPVVAKRGQTVNVDVEEWTPLPIPTRQPMEK